MRLFKYWEQQKNWIEKPETIIKAHVDIFLNIDDYPKYIFLITHLE